MGRKMYKKGLSDAMAANRGFMEKQQAAIEHMRQEVRDGKDSLLAMRDLLQKNVGNIYDYLDAQEKALVYKLGKTFDIRDLESQEKQLLVAILYQLADDMDEGPTEQQRVYISSVSLYLGVVSPQTSVDLRVVEEIDSLEVQKAFKQIALEFFYLQDSDELSDQQEEFLGYFSLNRHQSEEIEATVSRIYNTIGPDGLATHYGQVLDETAVAQAKPAPSEELALNQYVDIPHGEETVYQNKIIHVRSRISCDGELVFENCELHYGEAEGNGEIAVKESGALQMKNCKIKCHGYGKENEFFVTAEEGRGAVVMEGCEFVDAAMFIQAERDIVLRNSKATNLGGGFIDCKASYRNERRVMIEDCVFSFPKWSRGGKSGTQEVIQFQTVNMVRCLVEGDLKMSSASDAAKAGEAENDAVFLSGGDGSMVQCSFRGMSNIIENFTGGKIAFSLTDFEDCVHVVQGLVEVTDCRIEHVSDFASSLKNGSSITNCQFNECYFTLLSTGFDDGVEIRDCEFDNWEGTDSPLAMLEFSLQKNGSRSDVRSCVFNGIQAHESFIMQGRALKKLDGYAAVVDDCQFINCNTNRDSGKLIKEYCTYFGAFKREKEQRVIRVDDCIGLDDINHGSGRNKKVKRMLTNAAGERIGVQMSSQADEQQHKQTEERKGKGFLSWLFSKD